MVKPVILDCRCTIILEKLYENPTGTLSYATLYKATEPTQSDRLYRRTEELEEAGLITKDKTTCIGGCSITDFGKEVMARLKQDEELEK